MEQTQETVNAPSTESKPVRALILPGGGGRGAYQVGVIKALFERGLEFDMAFGTSIGGINATLLAEPAFKAGDGRLLCITSRPTSNAITRG